MDIVSFESSPILKNRRLNFQSIFVIKRTLPWNYYYFLTNLTSFNAVWCLMLLSFIKGLQGVLINQCCICAFSLNTLWKLHPILGSFSFHSVFNLEYSAFSHSVWPQWLSGHYTKAAPAPVISITRFLWKESRDQSHDNMTTTHMTVEGPWKCMSTSFCKTCYGSEVPDSRSRGQFRAVQRQ